jgi:hypothetical protein
VQAIVWPQRYEYTGRYLDYDNMVTGQDEMTVSSRLTLFFVRVISFTLKLEATHSSETSVYNKPTRCHIPEGRTVHSHLRENLKSYTGYSLSLAV